ncbi:signal peptide containing protein [Theileria equi strain WA]|uniref:Signal peptide containing protein n=1 Tax=Theileria equi strain WA TaxID=1537102 RepID=L1LER0_THEEQ|nr:signal peptide containing protein [Theileria equi strain WA]EKX73927.1 signal peptide containing protein [Theileria equi strain WA]|eukprot:XP_004833379.1 signal peptide containing protein [Theileria equi strain WA]
MRVYAVFDLLVLFAIYSCHCFDCFGLFSCFSSCCGSSKEDKGNVTVEVYAPANNQAIQDLTTAVPAPRKSPSEPPTPADNPEQKEEERHEEEVPEEKPKEDTKPESSVPQLTTTPVTLDLAKPDSNSILVRDESNKEITKKRFTSKTDYHISSVVDGDKELWEGGHVKASSSVLSSKDDIHLLFLETDNNGNIFPEFFEKSGEEWTEIDIDEFLKKQNEMRAPAQKVGQQKASTIVETLRDPLTIDIAKIDEETVLTSPDVLSGIKRDVYVPKGSYYFNKIVDDTKTVWEAGNGEKCWLIYDCSRENFNRLLHINVKQPSGISKEVHFEKNNDRWSHITREEFSTKYNGMRDTSKDSKIAAIKASSQNKQTGNLSGTQGNSTEDG